MYGYIYDGTNPAFQACRYACASTGGFGRTGNFTAIHQGGVAVFGVSDFLDVEPGCRFLTPDANDYRTVEHFPKHGRSGGVN